MKVLIVTNIYPSDGHPYHGIFVKEQVEAIKRLHSNVDIDVHYINGFGGKIEYLKSIWGVNRRIYNGHYDLVHIHYGLSGIYLYWPFTSKIPTVVTFHGSDIQPQGGNGIISVIVSRKVARMADAAIILNDDMEAMVKPYCHRTYMIPCAVDMNTFKPMHRTVNHTKTQIIFPSSHERQVKNYPLFCEVLRILKEKYDIDAEERELKNLTRVQIAQLYSNSDILLMTSKSEGSPQAVKEAMCCNLSCVSTPVGDVKVLLDGVRNSYVANTHSVEELAELVAKSLRMDGVGLTGREKAIKMQLDEESIANKVYNLYNEILKLKKK